MGILGLLNGFLPLIVYLSFQLLFLSLLFVCCFVFVCVCFVLFSFAPGQVNLHEGPSVISLHIAGSSIRAGVPIITISLFLLPFLCGFSVFCCVHAVQSAISPSSGGVALYVGVDSLCQWEEVSSGSFAPPSWSASSYLLF